MALKAANGAHTSMQGTWHMRPHGGRPAHAGGPNSNYATHPTHPIPTHRQGKGKGKGEGRLGQGGRGRSKGGEKPMGTTGHGGKGSKGRAANGDRPVGAASCRRDHHTMASCQNPHTSPCAKSPQSTHHPPHKMAPLSQEGAETQYTYHGSRDAIHIPRTQGGVARTERVAIKAS